MKPITLDCVNKSEGDYAAIFRYPGESATKEQAKIQSKDAELFAR